jgi:hypothetical protein
MPNSVLASILPGFGLSDAIPLVCTGVSLVLLCWTMLRARSIKCSHCKRQLRSRAVSACPYCNAPLRSAADVRISVNWIVAIPVLGMWTVFCADVAIWAKYYGLPATQTMSESVVFSEPKSGQYSSVTLRLTSTFPMEVRNALTWQTMYITIVDQRGAFDTITIDLRSGQLRDATGAERAFDLGALAIFMKTNGVDVNNRQVSDGLHLVFDAASGHVSTGEPWILPPGTAAFKSFQYPQIDVGASLVKHDLIIELVRLFVMWIVGIALVILMWRRAKSWRPK